jgi:hypothetical protein
MNFAKRFRAVDGRALDMSGVHYVPAAKLQELVRMHQVEPFRLTNVGKELMAQLELTRLCLFFEIEGYRAPVFESEVLHSLHSEEQRCKSWLCRSAAGLVALLGILDALQWAGWVRP